MTTVEFVTGIAYNQFPAKLTGPDGQVRDKLRVVLTPTLLVAYGEKDRGGGKRRAHTVEKVALVGIRPQAIGSGWIATDTTGAEWSVQKGSGCGCGSPLRHMPSPPPVDL